MTNRRLVAALLASVTLASVSAGAAGAATKTTKKTTKTTKKSTKTTKKTTATTRPAATTAPVAGATSAETAPTPRRPANVNLNAEVKIGSLSPSRIIDPHKSFSVADWTFEYPVFDRLVQIDENLQIQPMLASAWKFSPDGKQMDITLRRDIFFQDNTPINAAAVKANIERGKTLDGSTVKGFLAPIQSVEVVNDYTVRFNMSGQGGAGIMAALSQGPGMIINPKAFGKNIDNGPGDGNGSGAYRVVSYKAGDNAVYERVDFKYWDPSAGLLKRWTNVFTTSANILNGIKAGDYVGGQVSGVQVADVRNDVRAGRLEAFFAPQRTTQNVMAFNVNRQGSPIQNKLIRQAIAYGINKKAVGEFLFQGNCEPSETYYQKGHWVYDQATAEKYRYDPTKAKQLVAESGIANPTIRIAVDGGSTTSRPILEALADDLERQIGIKVQIDPRPATDVSVAFASGQVDGYVGQLSGTGNVDPENFFNSYFMPGASSGVQLGSNPAAFAGPARAAANPALSVAQRAALYKPIFADIQENVYFVSVCNQVQVYPTAANSKVRNAVATNWWGGLPDYRNAYVVN